VSVKRPRVTLGADGWRGRIGEGFTPATAAMVGEAAAQVLGARGARTALISHDARRLSAASAQAVVAAVAPHLRATLVPHLPTPVATHELRQRNFDMAILITASHNPADWNGVKVRVAPGIPVDRGTEQEIEYRLDEGRTANGAPGLGVAAEANEAERFVSGHADRILALAGDAVPHAHIVVDGLHGIAGPPIAAICRAFGWQTHELGSVPDPSFRGLVPDPVLAASRGRAAKAIRETGADFGLVLDGDGDRLWVLDQHGAPVPPAVLFAMLLEQEARHWKRRLPVALTVACGAALVPVCQTLKIPVIEVPVGFKHIAPLLASGKALAGAGGVGDLAFTPYCFDRDPAVALALLARLLRSARTGRPGVLVKRFADRYGWMFREERHVRTASENQDAAEVGGAVLERLGLSADVLAITKIDGIKFTLKGGGWILLRPSSTEGGFRVLIENQDMGVSQQLAEAFETAFRDE
jgi:phosphomannomutase